MLCECDRGSVTRVCTLLHDDHACIVPLRRRGVLAYKLQKEEKLTPDEVRDRIIAQLLTRRPHA